MEGNFNFDPDAFDSLIEEEFGQRDAVSARVIGTSWLKRNIYALKIGTGSRKILFSADGGCVNGELCHGMIEWVKALADAGEKNTAVAGCKVRNLLTKCTLFVVPCLNPDGMALHLQGLDSGNPFSERIKKINPSGNYSAWEANGRGIDLRRNFNSKWIESKLFERRNQRLFPAPSGFGGEYPESEFETGALCLLIKSEKPEVYVTVTCGEGGITGFYPQGDPPDARRGAEVCAAITKIPHRVADDRDLYGSPEGWFAHLFGKAAFRIATPEKGRTASICTMFTAVI